MIKRLMGALRIFGFALRYLVARGSFGGSIAKFLSSDFVGREERRTVLKAVFVKESLHFRAPEGPGEADTSADRVKLILNEGKNVSYSQQDSESMTRASLGSLMKMFEALNQGDFRSVSSVIDQLISTELCDDVVRQEAYSQEGEDLIIARLNRSNEGFFVDIGAHHPTRFSNTYKLYRKGWRGINIDPLPGGMLSFKKLRPDDINLEIAISDTEEGASLKYYMFDEPAFNSLEARNIEDAEAFGAILTGTADVPARSIRSVLDANSSVFTDIDLLTIDVEHHELNILESFPFDTYKPKCIVVEIKGLALARLDSSPIYALLSGYGYELRSYLFHSAVFEWKNEDV